MISFLLKVGLILGVNENMAPCSAMLSVQSHFHLPAKVTHAFVVLHWSCYHNDFVLYWWSNQMCIFCKTLIIKKAWKGMMSIRWACIPHLYSVLWCMFVAMHFYAFIYKKIKLAYHLNVKFLKYVCCSPTKNTNS